MHQLYGTTYITVHINFVFVYFCILFLTGTISNTGKPWLPKAVCLKSMFEKKIFKFFGISNFFYTV